MVLPSGLGQVFALIALIVVVFLGGLLLLGIEVAATTVTLVMLALIGLLALGRLT